jgi:hypothetical protein
LDYVKLEKQESLSDDIIKSIDVLYDKYNKEKTLDMKYYIYDPKAKSGNAFCGKYGVWANVNELWRRKTSDYKTIIPFPCKRLAYDALARYRSACYWDGGHTWARDAKVVSGDELLMIVL